MREHTEIPEFDFTPIALAIRKAREARGMSRDDLAEKCDVSTGYIKSIENTGKNPGFQLAVKLVTLFGISLDPFLYPDREVETDSERQYIMGVLGDIRDDEVYMVTSLVDGLARHTEPDSGKEGKKNKK